MSNPGNEPNEDDNFGLPDLDYKPLSSDTGPETPPADPVPAPSATEQSAGSSAFDTLGREESVEPDWGEEEEPVNETVRPEVSEPYRPVGEAGVSPARVLMYILIPVFLLAGGYFGYEYLIRQPGLKKKEIELALKKEQAERARKEAEAKKAAASAPKEVKAPEPPPVGTIEVLTAPTKRFYVVVASSLDGDLIMDKARKLSLTGVSCKVIPPYGKWKFHRLGILDQETFALAQAKAEESKATFGNDIWVIRY